MGVRFKNEDPSPDEWKRYVSLSSSDGATVVIEKRIYANFSGKAVDLGAIPSCPDPGFPAGLISIDGENSDGVIIWRWTFRSDPVTGATVSGSSGVNGTQTIRELSGATSQSPIQMHKSFEKMYTTYGRTMRAGRVEWLDKDPEASSGSGLSQSPNTINPMKGVDFYLKAMTVYSDTKFYASRSAVPGDIATDVGKLSQPPGVESGQGSDTENQWLQIAATVSQVGQGYRVDKKWMRDERGWLPELYK